MSTHSWLLLVTSLPGRRGAERMRIWRALKACGAEILRDGVYVLPLTRNAGEAFDAQVANLEAAGGSAYVLPVSNLDAATDRQFVGLFDRCEAYDEWQLAVAEFQAELATLSEAGARRAESRLRRAFEGIADSDFFPSESRTESRALLQDMTARINDRFSPDEPQATGDAIVARRRDDYSTRVWATRRGLWVDRIASAWLIRRFIDTNATFVWLDAPADCPPQAVGFDFDGAEFTHVGERVTFEVLLSSFELDSDPALNKLGTLVHYVDVGGAPVPDAAGFVTMLAGIKQSSDDDDALLDASCPLLDHLWTAYAGSENS